VGGNSISRSSRIPDGVLLSPYLPSWCGSSSGSTGTGGRAQDALNSFYSFPTIPACGFNKGQASRIVRGESCNSRKLAGRTWFCQRFPGARRWRLNGGGDVLASPMGDVVLVALTRGEWVSFGPQQVNGATSVRRSIPGIHSCQTVESQAMR
jgi:hypothetical protein